MILMGAKGDLSKTAKEVKSLRFSCGTSAARIIDASDLPDHTAIHIANVSNTPVFIGASDVDTVATAGGKGYPICMDGGVCSESSITLGAHQVWCIVASGTVVVDTITVRE